MIPCGRIILKVFEKQIPRQIFGHKWDKRGVESMYRLSNTIRLIKFRRLRCGELSASLVEGKSTFKNFNRQTYDKESFRKT